MTKHKAFLLLGSNLGNRLSNINSGIQQVSKYASVVQTSSIYNTMPWGIRNQPDFLNQVIEIETDLNPETLLLQISEIEKSFQHAKIEKWGARYLDIDILLYNNIILEGKLTIPHPEIPNRKFTLVPLCEIAPGLVHPIFNKTVAELLKECRDFSEVSQFVHDL